MRRLFVGLRPEPHGPRRGRQVRDFNEPRFFTLIGGSSAGAYMRTALDRRLHSGYPVTGLGDASQAAHKIKAYYRVPLDATSVKAALLASPGNGGVLFIGPWFHRWFHPYASGKLPPPDYQVGGHAIWARGWNDSLGVRLHNSCGPTWGLSGDCFLPYAYLGRVWEIWQGGTGATSTTDPGDRYFVFVAFTRSGTGTKCWTCRLAGSMRPKTRGSCSPTSPSSHT